MTHWDRRIPVPEALRCPDRKYGLYDLGLKGCAEGMSAPDVYDRLLKLEECKALELDKRLKWMNGHYHCNYVMKSNTGVDLGSNGMTSRHCCRGERPPAFNDREADAVCKIDTRPMRQEEKVRNQNNFGIPILQTEKANQDGKVRVRLLYFPTDRQGEESNYTQQIECFRKEKFGSEKCKHEVFIDDYIDVFNATN